MGQISWPDAATVELVTTRLQFPVQDTGRPLLAGIDVGAGGAETVVYICESLPDRLKILKLGSWRGEDTRGRVARFLEPYRSRLAVVRVDAIGIGHNFGLHLRDLDFPVELVNVALPCETRPERGENDPARRFANRKAELYQDLADAFERNQVEGLSDDTTLGQLASVLYEIDSRGRIRIEPKEKARQRGVPSPDCAEALMLAFEPAAKNVTSAYDYARSVLGSASSQSLWAEAAQLAGAPDSFVRHFAPAPKPSAPDNVPGQRLIDIYLNARRRFTGGDW